MKISLRWIITLFALPLLGCGDGMAPNPPERHEPRVGVFLYKADDTYISLVNASLNKALEGRAQIVAYYAEDRQLTQNRQIDEALTQKADALAINLVDTQSASILVDKAKKFGIPVVFFNREPDLDSLKHYDKACFVGTPTDDAGKMQGDMIKHLWDQHPEYDRNKDGKFQYIMFQGNIDNPEALARTEFSVKRARELGLDMRQTGLTNVCDWDEKRAYQAMRQALAADGNAIELVIANNDSMALGAIAALQEIGFNTEGGPKEKFIPVVGVDATPQAVEAIKKGVMSATVKQDSDAMGTAVAVLIMNAVNGKHFLAGSQYAWDSSGVAVRIAYQPLN